MIDDDFSMISLFNFPYEPYPEQGKLMAAIHECIESSSVGCFESPTGTGKSLSAICASFYWLLQEEKRIKDKIAQANSIMSATVPEDDWMADFCSSKVATESVTSGGDPVSLLAQHNAMLQRVARSKTQRSQLQKANSRRQSTAETASTIAAGETDEFALKNYDSEEERNNVKARIYASGSEDSDSDNSISANSSGAKPREKGSRGKRKKNAAELLQMPQIFYCSRTHSQLAQFVAEMNKTPHAKQDPITGIVPIRCVTLGSRKNMCINSAVTRLKSESSMSEACLEMQKPSSRTVAPSNTQKTPTIGKLSYLLFLLVTYSIYIHGRFRILDRCLIFLFATLALTPGSKKMKLRGVRATCEFHSRTSERHLADRALSQVQDIEDVVTLAHDTSACPYYASRRAVQDANVVCLPYSMLLNKEMRDSLGLTVAGKLPLLRVWCVLMR